MYMFCGIHRSILLLDVEEGDNTSSKHRISTKKRQLPITPHPPPSVKPQPPSKHLKRPHTAGDFHSRRYRQRSVEEPVQLVDTSHHNADRDGGKLEDSRQPDHLIDINGQPQDIHSLKDHPVNDPEQKLPKKCVVFNVQNQPVIVSHLLYT